MKHHARVGMISAGELSGDLLAADLALALKQKIPHLKLHGVTGPAMEKAGIKSVFSIDRFRVMGFVEVLKKVHELRMTETLFLSKVDQINPEFVILVDFPGFHFRVAEQLKLRGIPVYQYVAPKLWAWGASRVHKLKRDFEHVIGVLPFEEKFFLDRGVSYSFVGSPVRDRISRISVTKEQLGFDANQPLLLCLPGSRPDELKRLLPDMFRVVRLIHRSHPEVQVKVGVADGFAIEELRDWAAGPVPENVEFIRDQTLELMAAADAALVASGTATLECGLLETPMVVMYAMDWMTYQLAYDKVKISDFSLLNLVLGETFVKEYIQEYEISTIAEEVQDLLFDPVVGARFRKKMIELKNDLSGDAAINAAELLAEKILK